jgi:hypothetical protein
MRQELNTAPTRRFSHLWTIIATIAGVIGAGAAVYPLLRKDNYGTHLIIPTPEEPRYVWVEPLNDPITLTGEWYIKRGSWWNRKTLRDGNVVRRIDDKQLEFRSIKDLHVPANERRLVSIDDGALGTWANRPLKSCSAGEFELGIEYMWKGGISWARTTLPFCVKR